MAIGQAPANPEKLHLLASVVSDCSKEGHRFDGGHV
jgi:hypothetical protein